MLAIGCVLTGGLLALLAWRLARADRLSPGHGVAWVLVGLALLAAGLTLKLAGRDWGGLDVLALALGAPLVLLLAVCIAQACAITRLQERVKRLAQDVALLHALHPEEGEAPPAEPASAAPQAARREKGGESSVARSEEAGRAPAPGRAGAR